jgi:hypothetical protein
MSVDDRFAPPIAGSSDEAFSLRRQLKRETAHSTNVWKRG